MAGSNSPKAGNCDRRRAARAIDAQGETVLVWIEGRSPQAAVFLDESDHGIGVALHDHVPLKVGQRLEVVFRGMARAGMVSSLRSYHDVLRVGLEWANPSSQLVGR